MLLVALLVDFSKFWSRGFDSEDDMFESWPEAFRYFSQSRHADAGKVPKSGNGRFLTHLDTDSVIKQNHIDFLSF
jgi:hypothetical protein